VILRGTKRPVSNPEPSDHTLSQSPRRLYKLPTIILSPSKLRRERETERHGGGEGHRRSAEKCGELHGFDAAVASGQSGCGAPD
jgi:hypothetical protein